MLLLTQILQRLHYLIFLLAHVGECVKKSIKNYKKTAEICPKKCDSVDGGIVCGSNGNSYK